MYNAYPLDLFLFFTFPTVSPTLYTVHSHISLRNDRKKRLFSDSLYWEILNVYICDYLTSAKLKHFNFLSFLPHAMCKLDTKKKILHMRLKSDQLSCGWEILCSQSDNCLRNGLNRSDSEVSESSFMKIQKKVRQCSQFAGLEVNRLYHNDDFTVWKNSICSWLRFDENFYGKKSFNPFLIAFWYPFSYAWNIFFFYSPHLHIKQVYHSRRILIVRLKATGYLVCMNIYLVGILRNKRFNRFH